MLLETIRSLSNLRCRHRRVLSDAFRFQRAEWYQHIAEMSPSAKCRIFFPQFSSYDLSLVTHKVLDL